MSCAIFYSAVSNLLTYYQTPKRPIWLLKKWAIKLSVMFRNLKTTNNLTDFRKLIKCFFLDICTQNKLRQTFTIPCSIMIKCLFFLLLIVILKLKKKMKASLMLRLIFSFDFFESNPFSLSICNCNYVQVEVAKCKVVGKDFN
jgi:hypothetical protein